MNRVAVIALLAAAPAVAHAETWTIDPMHSNAQFAVKHLMVSTVRGELGKVTGTVSFDPKHPEKTAIEATIDVTAINTRDEKRDGHLKSPDFFDVAKYPTIKFKSTKAESVGERHFKVTGDLTIRDITKPVVLDVEGPAPEQKAMGMVKSGAMATTHINRKDYGLKWNMMIEGNGGAVVADDVNVLLDIELNKGGGAPAPAKK